MQCGNISYITLYKMKPSVGRKAVTAAMMAAKMVVVTSVAWSAMPFVMLGWGEVHRALGPSSRTEYSAASAWVHG